MWQIIEKAPFVSAKRYLLAHADGTAFIGWRYYSDGHWITNGMYLRDDPPTHWMEIPSVPQSSPVLPGTTTGKQDGVK